MAIYKLHIASPRRRAIDVHVIDRANGCSVVTTEFTFEQCGAMIRGQILEYCISLINFYDIPKPHINGFGNVAVGMAGMLCGAVDALSHSELIQELDE